MPRATLSMSEREWRVLTEVVTLYNNTWSDGKDEEMIKIAAKITATWKRAKND